MRKEYDLTTGRRSPYSSRIGAAGRKAILDRYLRSENLVRLDDDLVKAFPDGAAVNAALRLVLELSVLPRGKRSKTKKSA